MSEKQKKVGRPKKKEYDEKQLFKNLMDGVDYCFDCTGEIKATAEELGMSVTKVKKLLITSGKLEYDETSQIRRLMAYGKSMNQIQKEMGLRKSSINSYLPYSKVPYKAEEISSNADRCEMYRKRKAAVAGIEDIESLWNCLLLFSGYTFKTAAGLKFSYEVKPGTAADNNRELFVDCEEKGITMSTIEKAYQNAVTMDVVKDSKDLGSSFGMVYLYSIFYRLGIIDVPDEMKEKMGIPVIRKWA